MGCDIHLYVEILKNNEWKSAHEWAIDEDGRFYAVDDDWCDPGRNYEFFAMLADVRNRFGIIPIDEARGLPDDAAPQTLQKSNNWGEDGHSHSWFTVQELMDYDWTQVIEMSGYVDLLTYFEWSQWAKQQGNGPQSFSQGVYGNQVKHLSMEEADALIAEYTTGLNYNEAHAQMESVANHQYVLAKWAQKYYQEAAYFLSNVMPQLWKLGRPEEVRIVFWFDN